MMAPEAGDAVKRVLTPDANGRVYCGQGRLVDEFEAEFANTIGLQAGHPPLGVNSCTAAIDLALHLIGVGDGDEVIVSPMTCSATNGCAVLRGASLVWADVDPQTGLMDPASVARMVTKKTAAVIAVDWAGRWCDYENLHAAAGWKVPIIEDAAHCLYIPQAHGDYVAWSFGPIKHLSCGGYGGALLVPEHQYNRAELLRWHGLDRRSSADFRCAQDIGEVGYRYHLTDDQAAVGLANLPMVPGNIQLARAHAALYCRQLRDVKGVHVPPYDEECDYWLHGLIVEQDRDAFAQALATVGIPTSRTHARNDNHTAYRQASLRQDGSLPGTTYFDDHQINIPGGAWLGWEDCRMVLTTVKAVARATAKVVV